MIEANTFSFEHISEISAKYKIDKQLVQKQVAALSLVHYLRESGLNFIFKGGTSLLCLITPPTRLSLDIDITVDPGTDISDILNDISVKQPFKRVEDDIRSNSHEIPKAHFKFYFDSFIAESKEEYILLDVLYEENLYPVTQDSRIPADFLHMPSPVTVKTPDINSILGDKLTAYAPNTTGIPYLRGESHMNMEIIKQLFDISNLIDHFSDVSITKESFRRISEKELRYRGQDNFTMKDVLDDIYNTGWVLLDRNEKEPKFQELLTGVNRLKNYIIIKGFHLDFAIIAAGKAAFLSRIIKYNLTSFDKFSGTDLVKGFEFTKDEYKRFNKLRKSNPQAFFYWYKALELN